VSKRSIRVGVALIVFAGLLVALPAATQTKEWDQAAVTGIAKQLAEVAGDLRSSVRRTPEPPGRRARRARLQALDDLRVVQGSVNSLARQLEAGAGREQTYPTYRRIRTLRRDIAQNARRALITEPTLGKLAAARELLDQLDPFYAPEVAADEEIETTD
jgi:hypothetical protein